MKTFILIFSLLTFNAAKIWANNLLPYIQMPVKSEFFLTFSSQGVQFKECATCPVISLKPATNVSFIEYNNPIELLQATEIFIRKKHHLVSVFYNRHTGIYDKIVFGELKEEGDPELKIRKPASNKE